MRIVSRLVPLQRTEGIASYLAAKWIGDEAEKLASRVRLVAIEARGGGTGGCCIALPGYQCPGGLQYVFRHLVRATKQLGGEVVTSKRA
jgi:hypothetical protein